jgi:hypothetical protein
MAIGIYFAPTSMTVAQYAEILQRLKKAGAGHPKGRRYHACFGEPDKLQVFDIWDSQATFDAFGQTLMPILTAMGADTAQPMVMPVHSIIVPPAKKAAPRRAAAKPARAKKAKAGKKAKAAKTRRGKK